MSVCRFRASLSAFFAWCVHERMITINPVVNAKVPKSSVLATSINPFTETELDAVYRDAVKLDPWLAEIILVLRWTGCRWSELKALQPADFVERPHPALLVRRAQPDGVDLKATKSRQSRWVPVADRILPIVRDRVEYGHSWLFSTSSGSQLNGSNFRRDIWNTINRGRRVHDLRHTAACLWLTRGVDVATVSTWLGHSSLNITYIYVRHLGTSADHAALQRLNYDPGCAGGADTGEASDRD